MLTIRVQADMEHYGAELAYLGPAWFQAEWILGQFNRDL